MAISEEPSHGALIFWSNTIEHTCRFQLEPREEHTFGREDVGKYESISELKLSVTDLPSRMLGIVFPTLSKRHLYIRCILFEEETAPHIPLLIYAQDLGSRNGTYIEGAGGKPRPLGSAPRLLCHGDTLELTPSLFVTVDLDSSSSEEKAFTPVQEDEIKVSPETPIVEGKLIKNNADVRVDVQCDTKEGWIRRSGKRVSRSRGRDSAPACMQSHRPQASRTHHERCVPQAKDALKE